MGPHVEKDIAQGWLDIYPLIYMQDIYPIYIRYFVSKISKLSSVTPSHSYSAVGVACTVNPSHSAP